ncbi:MAG: TIGR03936 family radical SAM-associated protein, partial [Proteobacteria bacterium]|nr:TIGR03936 family radical SAM-associated protein [Pseudomonadota bacterium]
SLSTGDYRSLPRLLPAVMDQAARRKVALGLPSLRAATLTAPMMDQIKRVRKTGFTLAPEAATQRLRDVINKGLTEEDLFTTVRAAFQAGWNLMKLYFMIGLPTETDDDRAAIGRLCGRLLAEARRHKPGARLNVSVSLFVPKPHTPFKWAAQLDRAAAGAARDLVREGLPRRGVKLKWSRHEMSLLEGVFARGDRRLGPVLGRAFDLGCRFDGWTDELRFDLWAEAFAAHGVDPGSYLAARDPGAPLPWDHLDTGASRDFLLAERARSLTGEATADCRDGVCQDCGVCDFETLEPVVYADWSPPTRPPGRAEGPEPPPIRYRFEITKEGPARFLGHLEYQEAVIRTLRRAEVRLRHSQGFHPLPKVSLSPALPVGLESYCEAVVVEFLPPPPTVGQVIERFNHHAPEGIRLLSGRPVTKKKTDLTAIAATFRLSVTGAALSAPAAAAFLERTTAVVVRHGPKGDKSVDLRRQVRDVRLLSDTTAELEVSLEHGHPRAAEILAEVFGASPEAAVGVRLVKVSAAY